RGAYVELDVEAGGVPPPHPLERREPDLLDGPPRSALTDQLGLVEVVDRLCHRVIKAVTDGPRGGGRAELDDPPRVDHRGVVRPMVRVLDQHGEISAGAPRGHVERL